MSQSSLVYYLITGCANIDLASPPEGQKAKVARTTIFWSLDALRVYLSSETWWFRPETPEVVVSPDGRCYPSDGAFDVEFPIDPDTIESKSKYISELLSRLNEDRFIVTQLKENFERCCNVALVATEDHPVLLDKDQVDALFST